VGELRVMVVLVADVELLPLYLFPPGHLGVGELRYVGALVTDVGCTLCFFFP
jgi:hypothetical protein